MGDNPIWVISFISSAGIAFVLGVLWGGELGVEALLKNKPRLECLLQQGKWEAKTCYIPQPSKDTPHDQ